MNVDPLLEKIEKAACYTSRYEFNKLELEKLEKAESWIKKEHINAHISFCVSNNRQIDLELEALPVQLFMDFAKPFLKKRTDKALSKLEKLLK